MLLVDEKTWVERGRDIEKTDHRVIDGKRNGYKGPANRRRSRIKAIGRGYWIIGKSEEYPCFS